MIPVVDDLKSAPMVHRYGDLFNPPGLTNFLGCVQVDLDLVGIRSLNFPPFACSDTITASLFLDGRFFQSNAAPITFTWFPDRIEREAIHDGLHIRTITALAWRKPAAIVQIRIENRGSRARDVQLKLGLKGNITKLLGAWSNALPPCELDNLVHIDEQRGAIRFSAQKENAHSVQGISPRATRVSPGILQTSVSLKSGESKVISFVDAIGETASDAQALYDALISDVASQLNHVRSEWNRELRAIFTPGNDRYSGFLPTLHTSDKDILKLYHTGILGVIYFKRDTPFSVYGRAYATLMPRYWQPVTFIWDYSLSSMVHALLDPAVMRKYLELWMHTDIH